MKLSSDHLYTLLQEYKNKTVLIICENSFTYKARDLVLIDEALSFTDKYGKRVLLSIDQITSIQEVRS